MHARTANLFFAGIFGRKMSGLVIQNEFAKGVVSRLTTEPGSGLS